MKRQPNNLISTPAAADKLGITVAQFRRLTSARGINPDETYVNPHHATGPPAALWAPKTLARIGRTKDLATSRARTGGRPPKDYATPFDKKYGAPKDAIADACEAMCNLNRYTRHDTCSEANKLEIPERSANCAEGPHERRLRRTRRPGRRDARRRAVHERPRGHAKAHSSLWKAKPRDRSLLTAARRDTTGMRAVKVMLPFDRVPHRG